jgi:hypothetical protein
MGDVRKVKGEFRREKGDRVKVNGEWRGVI